MLRQAFLFLLIVVPAVLLIWLIWAPHTPVLSPAQAEKIIAAAPEFMELGTRPSVSWLQSRTDSDSTSSCWAIFSFVPNDSTIPVKAEAWFILEGDAWHLRSWSRAALPKTPHSPSLTPRVPY